MYASLIIFYFKSKSVILLYFKKKKKNKPFDASFFFKGSIINFIMLKRNIKRSNCPNYFDNDQWIKWKKPIYPNHFDNNQ